MDYRLEVVVVPVSDVDRAKAFYAEGMGFHVDHDAQPTETMRVVQLTPPGSACSIVIGTGLPAMEPGSLRGLQLVVDAGEVQLMGPPDTPGSRFLFLGDPDGNGWAIQELRRQ